jgi:hypothetical protein
MIVDETTSLVPLSRIKKASEIRKQHPQIKASLDKNNSQRMDDFHVK